MGLDSTVQQLGERKGTTQLELFFSQYLSSKMNPTALHFELKAHEGLHGSLVANMSDVQYGKRGQVESLPYMNRVHLVQD